MTPHNICRRCGHRFDTHYGHYAIGFHTRDPMRWVNLCDSCADNLHAWIGIPPVPPPLPEPPPINQPPVSLCQQT